MSRQDLERIFRAGLKRVDPLTMIRERVRLVGSRLMVAGPDRKLSVDLDDFNEVVLLGVGKGAAPMAQAVEQILGARLDQGLAVTKYGHSLPLPRTEMLEAAHPVPDQAGVDAAHKMLELARACGPDTLVIMLVSGGGSALLPLPASSPKHGLELTLAHKQAATKALLACGADITEINILRKHLSGLKGGRLLQALAPARCLNLILSDVIGDDLSAIASGLTVPDPSTYAQALAIIDTYAIADSMTAPVLKLLRLGAEGHVDETLKPGDPVADLADNILLGTNGSALEAAANEATRLGYEVRVLDAPVQGEARIEAAKLAGMARDIRGSLGPSSRPLCLLSGGEPVVTLRGSGKGGRNQEMGLAFLREIERTPDELAGVFFLAGATDGTDGPTDAAGAFADADALRTAETAGLSIQATLGTNDSYNFFQACDGLFITGPTRTNVCDLHVMVINKS